MMTSAVGAPVADSVSTLFVISAGALAKVSVVTHG